jgi:hypothetical protein
MEYSFMIALTIKNKRDTQLENTLYPLLSLDSNEDQPSQQKCIKTSTTNTGRLLFLLRSKAIESLASMEKAGSERSNLSFF